MSQPHASGLHDQLSPADLANHLRDHHHVSSIYTSISVLRDYNEAELIIWAEGYCAGAGIDTSDLYDTETIDTALHEYDHRYNLKSDSYV